MDKELDPCTSGRVGQGYTLSPLLLSSYAEVTAKELYDIIERVKVGENC